MREAYNIFEFVLLIVGAAVGFLGFHLINQVYLAEAGQISWLMIIAIFTWLTLMVLFILLSLVVDTSKKELKEIETIIDLFSKRKKK